MDCTEGGKDTCGRFEVRGYPTLKIFRNGEMSQVGNRVFEHRHYITITLTDCCVLKDYNGPREANGIVKFMKSQVGPASLELKTLEDLKKFR